MHIKLCTGAEPKEGEIFDFISEYSIQFQQVANLGNAIHHHLSAIGTQTVDSVNKVQQEIIIGFEELRLRNKQMIQK